jgi:hypothetical protein
VGMQHGDSSKKMKLLYDPAIPLLGHIFKRISMFMTALLTIDKK